VDPNCGRCDGDGLILTGAVWPWGEAVTAPCPDCSEERGRTPEDRAEDLGEYKMEMERGR
jgi:hypothetical protein